MTDQQAIIQLEGIKKVFYTDEVETHALSDIHLEVTSGEYLAIDRTRMPQRGRVM